jgi:hypothetical protein
MLYSDTPSTARAFSFASRLATSILCVELRGQLSRKSLHKAVFQGEARLAPVYDLATTSVYLPKDSMALTLNGAREWASARESQRLGETRLGASPARVREILGRIDAAIKATSVDLRTYMKDHMGFEDIGNHTLQQWERGIARICEATHSSFRREITLRSNHAMRASNSAASKTCTGPDGARTCSARCRTSAVPPV